MPATWLEMALFPATKSTPILPPRADTYAAPLNASEIMIFGGYDKRGPVKEVTLLNVWHNSYKILSKEANPNIIKELMGS